MPIESGFSHALEEVKDIHLDDRNLSSRFVGVLVEQYEVTR